MRTGWAATYMPTSLRGIAYRARKEPKARFRDLYRLLNEANLRDCFYGLRKSAAPGVDQMTFGEYERNLDANLANLADRLKRKRYHARLVRRKHIPKGNGKTRPLGIPVLEDKLAEKDVVFYANPVDETQVVLTAGMYGIFFPWDVHRPNCALLTPAPVRKVILKICMESLK